MAKQKNVLTDEMKISLTECDILYKKYGKSLALSFIQLLEERSIPNVIGYIILMDLKKAFELDDPRLKRMKVKKVSKKNLLLTSQKVISMR